VHGLTSDRRHWLRDSIRENLVLQSWTQNGRRRYWVVCATAEGTAPANSTPRRRARLAALHQEEQEHIAINLRGQSTTDTGSDDLALTSNWMRRTGWAQTFAGANRSVLLTLTQGPAASGRGLELGSYNGRTLQSSIEDERALAAAERALDRFFDRCEDTVQHTDSSIRCWLRGQIPGQPYKAAFELPGRKATRKRYRALCKRFVFFMLRLSRLGGAVCAGLLLMQPSEGQLAAVREV
jgi:hypothetical protein